MIYLIGSGGHARSILEILLFNFASQDILIVDYDVSTLNSYFEKSILGCSVVKISLDDLPDIFGLEDRVYISVGNLYERKKILHSIARKNVVFPSTIAHSALVSSTADISEVGVSIHHRAYVAPLVSLGDFTIVNSGAILEHEVVVGHNSHIGPGAIITGRCKIGCNVFVGAGAIVTNSAKVADNVTIGAGAVVVCDLLEENSIYIGVPAKKK